MGVKGFLYMIKTCYVKTLVSNTNTQLLLIDGNCILHEAVSDYTHQLDPTLKDILDSIIEKFKKTLADHVFNSVYICLDGVPPLPKQLCQKRRRMGNLYLSSLLLPGTKLMERIERTLVRFFQSDYVNIVSSNTIGEGEQKMIQILKRHPSDSVTLLSFDSDVVILSLLQIEDRQCQTVFVKIPSFNITIDIKKLFVKFEEENLIRKLLWLCVLCGNDFFPRFIQFKDLTTREVFKLVKVQNITSFTDLYIEDNCCCNNMNNAGRYVVLWKWFQQYFSTNDFISTDPYTSDETPCAYCVSQNLNCVRIFSTNCNKDNHLEYVLSDTQRSFDV